nr:hypothetical protein [uncultured bacterium]
MRHRHDGGLSRDCRRSERRLLRTVVVVCDAAKHAVNRVAVFERVFESLEKHHAGAIAEHGAAGIGVERSAAAIGREHAALDVEVSARLRDGDGRGSREGHFAVTGDESMKRLHDRDERCRASGVNAQRRPLEVQLVSDARGDVVLLVRCHRRELTDLRDCVGPREHVVHVVAVVVRTREDADGSAATVGGVACVLENLPRELEEHPLLRVEHCRFARRDAEECGIEEICSGDDAARLHVRRVVDELFRKPRVELVVAEKARRLDTVTQVLPEGVDVDRSWKTAGHPDDGHATR